MYVRYIMYVHLIKYFEIFIFKNLYDTLISMDLEKSRV